MRAGAGQGLLVLVALHRVEDGLRLFQFAALGQAAGVEDQRRGVVVVLRQQGFQGRFGVADAAFGEQRLGHFQRVFVGQRRCFHMGFEQGADLRFGLGTGETVDRLAILEQDHGRQAADAEAHHDVLLDVAVDLGQQQFALVGLGDLRQQRHQRLARGAPVGPEVHQDRLVERVLDDQLLEVGAGDVEDVA